MAEESHGPLYSEKQAAAILKRAAERAAAASTGGALGISLSEMERIAAEIGIDPQHVREAAADVTVSGATASPGIIDLERIVPAELSEEAWDAVVSELRRVFGDPGTASAVGRAREWVLRQDTTSVHASLVSRNGATKVHLMENHSGAVGVAWMLWVMFSLMGVLIATVAGGKIGGVDQALINLLIAGGISGAAFLGLRGVARNWQRQQQARMEGLLQRITGLIREHRPAAVVTLEAESETLLPQAGAVAAEAETRLIARG